MPYHLFTGVFRTGFTSGNGNTGITGRYLPKNTAIFYHAQKAVLHSPPSLFDRETQTVHPRCERALKRIFMLSDHDKDGALTEAEMNDFQVHTRGLISYLTCNCHI
ncbi:putative EF-hand domain pair, EF-Hand 1, calcium-binding protein [Helianthus anomalus]